MSCGEINIHKQQEEEERVRVAVAYYLCLECNGIYNIVLFVPTLIFMCH